MRLSVAALSAIFSMKPAGTVAIRLPMPSMPCAVYSTYPYDRVTKNGRTVGISTWSGYSANERTMLSLAMVDVADAAPGTALTLVWGEEDGGTRKLTVERHKQIELRVTVAPAPYTSVARENYREAATAS